MQHPAVAQAPGVRRVERDLLDRRGHRQRAGLTHELAEQVAGVAVRGERLHVSAGVRRPDQDVVVGQHLADDLRVGVHQAAVLELRAQVLLKRDVDHRIGRRRPAFLGDIAEAAAEQRLVVLQRDAAHDRVGDAVAEERRA